MQKKILGEALNDNHARQVLYSLVPAVLGAALACYGSALSASKPLMPLVIRLQDLVRATLVFIVLLTINGLIICWIERQKRAAKRNTPFVRETNHWTICGLAVFTLWVPVFLAYYPTVWTYDVAAQVPWETNQAFSTHHPLIHTLFIQSFIGLSRKLTGGYESGMVALSIAQMAIMATVFGYACARMRGIVRVLLVLNYGLMPYNSIMSISQTKDTLFSGAMLVLYIILHDIVNHNINNKKCVAFCVASVCVVLLRNNARHVYLIFLLACPFLIKGIARKFIMIAGSLCLAFSLGANTIMTQMLSAKQGRSEEPFCVPMQCLTGLSIKYGETPNEKGLICFGTALRECFPEDMSSIYSPVLADPVKGCYSCSNDKQGEFHATKLVGTWLSAMASHPVDCINIWATLQKGSWYPDDTSFLDVYTNYPRQGYLLTDFKQFDGMRNARPESKLPELETLLEYVATYGVQMRTPVLRWIFAPSTYVWLLFGVLLIALYTRNNCLPLAIPLLYWATVLLGPCSLLRYLYPIMVIAPIAVCILALDT